MPLSGQQLREVVKNSDLKAAELIEKSGIPEQTFFSLYKKDLVEDKYIRALTKAGLPLPKTIIDSKPVPYYDVDAYAGNVTIFNEDKSEYAKSYISVPAFSDCDMFINISGNSMYPKFCSGELVALKKISDFDIVAFGEAYVIVTKEQRFLKYITKGTNKEHWKLKSENEADFQEFEVPIKKVLHLYIVKGKIAKNII